MAAGYTAGVIKHSFPEASQTTGKPDGKSHVFGDATAAPQMHDEHHDPWEPADSIFATWRSYTAVEACHAPDG